MGVGTGVGRSNAGRRWRGGLRRRRGRCSTIADMSFAAASSRSRSQRDFRALWRASQNGVESLIFIFDLETDFHFRRVASGSLRDDCSDHEVNRSSPSSASAS